MNRIDRMRILCLLAGLALTGCSADRRSSGPGDSGNSAGDRPRIALVMKSLANEFFATMAEGAAEHQAGHASEYELISGGIQDERDVSRQVSLVEEMVAAGADAIVIAPADSKALVSALRRAQREGVVVVNIDNRLDAEVLRSEGVTIPFVGPDNRQGARAVGDFAATRLRPGDPVVILEGIRTSFNGQQRRLGLEDAVRDAGLRLVDSQSAQWEMSQAHTIASSMLQEHPDLRAILACNDSMALGAVAAVKAAGRDGEVIITGFDNISAVRQTIREGRVLATADQHGDSLAVYGIELALQLLRNPDQPAQDRETPVDLVTAEALR